jgi:hypothetical protein
MNTIPAGVNSWYLVGEKFHKIHDTGCSKDQWVHEDLKAGRQHYTICYAKHSQNQDRGIKVDPAGPCSTHGYRYDFGYLVKLFHFSLGSSYRTLGRFTIGPFRKYDQSIS